MTFQDGVATGAEWQSIKGSLQDHLYGERGALSLTLALSCCKFPSSKDLEPFWKSNEEALLGFLERVCRGRAMMCGGSAAPPRCKSFVLRAPLDISRCVLPHAQGTQGASGVVLDPDVAVTGASVQFGNGQAGVSPCETVVASTATAIVTTNLTLFFNQQP